MDDVKDDKLVPDAQGDPDRGQQPASDPSTFAGALFDVDTVAATPASGSATEAGDTPAPSPLPSVDPAPAASEPAAPPAQPMPLEPARPEDYLAVASGSAEKPHLPDLVPAPVETPAAAPVQPTPEPPSGTQASLIAPEDVPVAVTAVPPAMAASTSDLTGATSVATYGDKDLDEIMAEIARSAAAAGAAEAAVGATVAAQEAAAAQPQPGSPEPGAEAAEGGVTGTATAVLPTVEGEQGTEESRSFVSAPWWPFLVYVGVWLVFAAGLAWVMKTPAAAGNLFDSSYYLVFLYGGLGLAAVSLILVLVVWLVYRRRYAKGQRSGLFSSALIKGSLALFIGVALWWASYYGAVWLAASAK